MTLVLLGEGEEPPRIVPRVREGEARREDVLRDLLFAQPAMLPVAEIDPAIGPLVPIARELNVPDVGRIDAFLADGRGHLVIVECKLWRNPQARREVVGQILDYARALARFSYDDLQREVSRASSGSFQLDLVASFFKVRRSRRTSFGSRWSIRIVGISRRPRRLAEITSASPSITMSCSSMRTGETHPNVRIEAISPMICSSGWFFSWRSYSRNASTGR